MRTLLRTLIPLFLLFASEADAGIVFIQANSSCGNPVGWLKAVPSGGVAPYTFAWNTGAQIDSIGGLVGGTGDWYVVTVTDALSQVQSDSAQIQDDAGLFLAGTTSYIVNSYGISPQQAMHPCPGQCDGGLVVHREYINGAAPFDVTFDMGGLLFNDDMGNPVFGGFCNGDFVTLPVYDAYGCMGTYPQQIVGPAGNSITIVQVDGACGGQANGSVDLTADPDEQVWLGHVEILDDAQQQVADLDGWQLNNDTATVMGLAPGNYTARVHYNPVSPTCVEDHPFTVQDLGAICGNVSGTVYFDHDQDCAQDGNDPGIPYRVLTINPGPEYAITDAAGHYARNLLTGDYTITATGSDLLQLCPVTSPVPFTIPSGGSVVVDLADSSTIDLDLEAIPYHLPARPGFTSSIHGWVRNLSGQLSGPVTVTLSIDPVFTLVSTDPTPTSVVGNVITWDLPNLNSFGHAGVWASVSLPPDVGLIGTPFTNTLTCTNTLGDAAPANNTSTDTDLITGSFDPNDKAVRTSSGQNNGQFLIETDEWLDYTIRFQNTGTDTAYTVMMLDTLSPALAARQIRPGVSSHPYRFELLDGHIAKFVFENILLPDSNVNLAGSEGFVQFRIPQLPDNPDGMRIENTAAIYFDFNPPVITNTVWHTVGTNFITTSTTYTDPARGPLRVYPNPAASVVYFASEETPGDCLNLLVTDALGREVRQVSATQMPIALDCNDLPAGTYFFRINAADARTVWAGTLMVR